MTPMWTAATLLADAPAAPYRHGVSLLHGWLPAAVEAVTVTVLLLAMGWHGRRHRDAAERLSTIGSDASGFKHRTEYVYLPPAWYATNPPPKLPVVMMIGGEFNTPADWLRTGNAAKTIDDFARAHGGNAPVFMLADSGGAFKNDTECVNGSRGNAADHLTKDLWGEHGQRELGRGGMVDGRYLRSGPHRDAPRTGQLIRRHRG